MFLVDFKINNYFLINIRYLVIDYFKPHINHFTNGSITKM